MQARDSWLPTGFAIGFGIVRKKTTSFVLAFFLISFCRQSLWLFNKVGDILLWVDAILIVLWVGWFIYWFAVNAIEVYMCTWLYFLPFLSSFTPTQLRLISALTQKQNRPRLTSEIRFMCFIGIPLIFMYYVWLIK